VKLRLGALALWSFIAGARMVQGHYLFAALEVLVIFYLAWLANDYYEETR
jgi:hypothetical protein